MHSAIRILLFVLSFEVFKTSAQVQGDLVRIREWKQMDFSFPNKQARDEAYRKGIFVPENNFPIDVDVDYSGEKFN